MIRECFYNLVLLRVVLSTFKIFKRLHAFTVLLFKVAMKTLNSVLTAVFSMFFSRYNEDLELEDAIHTAILTLKVSSVSTGGFKSIVFLMNCL